MPLTPTERILRARVAAHTSWANTLDPSARAKRAAETQLTNLEREIDPDGTLDPVERRRRAEQLRKANMARLALKSAKARRARKAAA